MSGAQEQLWRSVPDSHDNLVSCIQALQRSLINSCQSEISNLDDAFASEEYVGRLQITMQDKVAVEVVDPIEKLKEQ